MTNLIHNAMHSLPVLSFNCILLLTFLKYISAFSQLNIFVLAWSRDGQMLSIAEKVILPLVVVLVLIIIIVGNVAVSLSLSL